MKIKYYAKPIVGNNIPNRSFYMQTVDTSSIKKIIDAFPFEGELKNVEKTDTGLINSTYILTFSDGNRDFSYVLQRINTNVFRKPDELMSNIMSVTSFLRNKINLLGGNSERETLTFLYTKDNTSYYRTEDGECWRAYVYVNKCHTCDKVDSPTKAFRSGKAFGKFQKMLADYPAETLFEIIPDFHNTPARFNQLKEAISNNVAGKADEVAEEIAFALKREGEASRLIDLTAQGKIPLRVTHNDTKINNVLFDDITNEAFCVIDLDTVMPGLSLYDFGDSIRSGAVVSDENERDLEKFGLSVELFKGYAEGFLSEAGDSLTDTEILNLPFSAKLMALECGIRFLADYLNGNTYFSYNYPEHNLVRCRTQFKLVCELEERMDELTDFVRELSGRTFVEE